MRATPLRLLLPLLATLMLVACEKPDSTVRFTGSTMGTTYELQLAPTPGQTIPDDFQAQIDRLLAQINQRMSTYDPDSELSRFNRNPSTHWVEASPELVEVVAAALRVSELSEGAFDITVGPLVNLWGFGPDPRREEPPGAEAIARTRERVGYWRLRARAEPPALKKDRADLYIDLSGIAKGYGVDRLAALVETTGIQDYLVSIAGEIRVRGQNGRGQPWTIAIEKPVPGQRAVERLIRPGDRGVSTSGDYRNFFERDGQRYSHIIDPRTGRPVPQSLASVTVLGDRSMETDAIATALMAAGADAGFRLASEHRLAAYFLLVGPDGFQERHTPEFAPYLLPRRP